MDEQNRKDELERLVRKAQELKSGLFDISRELKSSQELLESSGVFSAVELPAMDEDKEDSLSDSDLEQSGIMAEEAFSSQVYLPSAEEEDSAIPAEEVFSDTYLIESGLHEVEWQQEQPDQEQAPPQQEQPQEAIEKQLSQESSSQEESDEFVSDPIVISPGQELKTDVEEITSKDPEMVSALESPESSEEEDSSVMDSSIVIGPEEEEDIEESLFAESEHEDEEDPELSGSEGTLALLFDEYNKEIGPTLQTDENEIEVSDSLEEEPDPEATISDEELMLASSQQDSVKEEESWDPYATISDAELSSQESEATISDEKLQSADPDATISDADLQEVESGLFEDSESEMPVSEEELYQSAETVVDPKDPDATLMDEDSWQQLPPTEERLVAYEGNEATVIDQDLEKHQGAPREGTEETVIEETQQMASDEKSQVSDESIEDTLSGEETAATILDQSSQSLLQDGSQGMGVGRIIDGKYKIEEFIGEGEVGATYKVSLIEAPQPQYFALKIVSDYFTQHPDFMKSFKAEIEKVMKFSHPHALNIQDYGEVGSNLFYIVTEYSTGESLNRVIQRENKLSSEKALAITRQILELLKDAHAKNFLHTALKTHNIFVEEKNNKLWVLVADIGLANVLKKKMNGSFSPLYISPEQASGKPLDKLTDLYSLGVILYEMVAGQPPFVGNHHEVCTGHRAKTPPSPSSFNEQLSYSVERIILKALQKDRRKRFASAQEFLKAIDQQTSKKRGFLPLLGRSLKYAFVLFLLLLVVATGIFIWQVYEQQNLEQQFYQSVANKEWQVAEKKLEEMTSTWFFGVSQWPTPESVKGLGWGLLSQEQQQSIFETTKNVSQYLQHQVHENIGHPEIFRAYYDAHLAVDQKKLATAQESLKLLKSLGAKQQRLTKLEAAIAELKVDTYLAEGKKMLQEGNFASAQEKFAQSSHPQAEKWKKAALLAEEAEFAYLNQSWQEALTKVTGAEEILNQLTEQPLLSSFKDKIHREQKIFQLKEALQQALAKDDLAIAQEKLAQLKDKLSQPEWQSLQQKYQNHVEDLIASLQQKIQNEEVDSAGEIFQLLEKSQLDTQRLDNLEKSLQEAKEFARISGLSFEEQKKQWQRFLERYPNSSYRPKIKKLLKESYTERKKRLITLLQEGRKFYQEGKSLEARLRFKSYFQQGGPQYFPSKITKTVATYLGVIYYERQNWSLAEKWLAQAHSTPKVKAYQGITKYHLQDNLTALSLLSESAKEDELSRSLRGKLYQLAAELHQKLYPEQKQKVYEYLRKALQFTPEETKLYKKLGLITKELGDINRATEYLQKYLQKRAEEGREYEDGEAINTLLSLQKFYPLQDGWSWNYSVLEEGTQEYRLTLQLKQQQPEKYLLEKIPGANATLEVREGFIFRDGEKLLPLSITLQSRWQRDSFQVQIAGFNKKVTTAMGQYTCLLVTAVSKEKGIRINEYYAAGVGEVRRETYRNGELIAQRSLISHQK